MRSEEERVSNFFENYQPFYKSSNQLKKSFLISSFLLFFYKFILQKCIIDRLCNDCISCLIRMYSVWKIQLWTSCYSLQQKWYVAFDSWMLWDVLVYCFKTRCVLCSKIEWSFHPSKKYRNTFLFDLIEDLDYIFLDIFWIFWLKSIVGSNSQYDSCNIITCQYPFYPIKQLCCRISWHTCIFDGIKISIITKFFLELTWITLTHIKSISSSEWITQCNYTCWLINWRRGNIINTFILRETATTDEKYEWDENEGSDYPWWERWHKKKKVQTV